MDGFQQDGHAFLARGIRWDMAGKALDEVGLRDQGRELTGKVVLQCIRALRDFLQDRRPAIKDGENVFQIVTPVVVTFSPVKERLKFGCDEERSRDDICRTASR